MPTLEQIVDKQTRAKLVHADMVAKANALETRGGVYAEWNRIYALRATMDGMDNLVTFEDYVSVNAVRLYKLLECFVASRFPDGANLNPYAQQDPGVIYVGNQPPDPQSEYSFQKIFFNNATEVTLSNYHTVYYPLFGNGPTLAVYNKFINPDTDVPYYSRDEQTGEDVTYRNGDPQDDILTITWSYGVPTSGYILISGKKPAL